jgi:hypothetical protein
VAYLKLFIKNNYQKYPKITKASNGVAGFKMGYICT